MKNILKMFVFIILVSNAEAHVRLNFPSGGETFSAGDTINIRWQIQIIHPQENWDLFFSPDAGITWQVIQLDIDKSVLNYLWELPRIATQQGRIRIYMDNVSTDYQDESGNFTIEAIPITINVPGDQPSIQAGIDIAIDGDTVLVADGTYFENINYKGKAIIVASHLINDADTNHINNTVIDGSQPIKPDTASVVYFSSGEDTTSVLIGFTITGGTGTLTIEQGVETVRGGGGIYINDSGAKIEHNRIINNSVLMDLPGPDVRIAAGGGIAAITSDPHTLIINNNLIANNTSVSNFNEGFGGGIIVSENAIGAYDVFISDNEIINNHASTTSANVLSAGGGILGLVGKISVINNKVMYNTLSSPMLSIGAGIVFSETVSDGNSLIENNIVTNNSFLSGVGLGGGVDLLAAPSVTIQGNRIENNSSSLGGGIYILQSNPLINKNLIAGNTASEGGGGIHIELSPGINESLPQSSSENKVGKYSSHLFLTNSYRTLDFDRKKISNNFPDDELNQKLSGGVLEIRNNTIVNNSANGSLGGSGITSLVSTVKVMNSIVWGNQPSNISQIEGFVLASYSDIQGGYAGMGNIDINPNFMDEEDYYLDPAISPCIDAGNPDVIYNDPEDPLNSGFALLPALGSLINDMGVYGGNLNTGFQSGLLGPKFSAFVERVNSVPNSDKQAIIDSFMNAASSFPFIEENKFVYYIYQGTVGSVNVPGDANGWNPEAFPMTQLEGTIFWYREAVFESDARLDYKFVLNGNNWILDPLNPNQVSGGFGPNSELAMPDYVQPPEIEFYPNIPHGSIDTFSFTSTILGNTRTIKVYTPPGYDSHPNFSYPVVLFHDGLEYLTLGSADNILDYLISESRMNSVIAVFVPPVNRNDEYAFNSTQQFESFIVDELMPHIDSNYRTSLSPDKRAMVGLSFGGLITTQICYNNPENFGLAAPYSPAYWPNDLEVMNMVLSGPAENIQWYIDWGTYETGIMINGRSMRDGLFDKGYELIWREWHDGHSWGSWRAHLDIALEYFFPKTVDVADEESIPKEYLLSQNYPNPFNPSTIIKYSIPEKSLVTLKIFDIIGNEVGTLVNEEKSVGRYEAKLNAGNLSSGVYFYQIRAGSFIETKKMIFLK